jgi:GH24 family phage-related lysozyme (muramidase)
MTLLHQSVVDAFPEFSRKFEGRVQTMYADVRGLITTGVGNLIDPVGAALALPWRDLDGYVSHARIDAEWRALKARASEMARHNPPVQAKLCGLKLWLDEPAIDAMVRSKLEANANDIARRHFPRFADFPADAQLAIMSLAWAAGSGWPAKFPHANLAILAGDWAHAALEAVLSTRTPEGVVNAGVIPRNDAQKICFANAAAVDANGLDPAVLWYPSFPHV